jgi:hypothetical protein
MQQELSQERRNVLNTEKATPSQLAVKEKIKRALERKKEEDMKPRVRNYNDLRHNAAGFNLEVPNSSRISPGKLRPRELKCVYR